MSSKLILPAILIGAIVIGLIAFLFFGGTSQALIEDTIFVTLYESSGERTGTSLVSIPFLKNLESTRVSVSLDLNADGVYDENERVATRVPIHAQANWKNGFYFKTPDNIDAVAKAQVAVDEQLFDVNVVLSTSDVGRIMELETITNPEEAMKGVGVAYAQTDIEISNDDVPDLNQRPGECAPTAAANSLIDLVRDHGNADQQLDNPTQLIDDLKTHMQWTRANGVLPDDFVAGKNSWAQANGLPIETKKVGDRNGISTVEAIRDALSNGDAVELRIKFANPGGTQVVGGHMVTVTGIHQDGNETHLDINDPNTVDSGTETVEISGNQFTDYGPWAGITVLSWGFVQSWTGPVTETETGTSGAGTEGTSGTQVPDSGPINQMTADDEAFIDPPTIQSLETAFSHVKPGEYSEVYATILHVTPGEEITGEITGPGVIGSKTQIVVADENGQVRFVWRINQFGRYSINVVVDGVTHGNSVEVN